ncbi:TetR/AcrR family transcriptional regulator [Companilactobacillus bobalius]|uniref:TetR/AcrR family transcriptional regulator n=1 Tax=Companilactobacillus bobalius TaxID=2801451 RepID=A0A202FF86_9LACO|nr:TetR/AcrR family transcriptional regulator [Companilactobacillus bobalius]KAE9560425.1 hypothetical protein ATN92_09685 [Companilactobacillus bobalius]OVE99135.1 hypothetical protein LKACC16343_00247 [Companilactobacillus bobalius]GEO57111.1 transcriptional regulator [Companilactobacillus paralimentarius]
MVKQLFIQISCFTLYFLQDIIVITRGESIITEDLRVKKTKKTIEYGFLDCVKKNTFSKITVKELTDTMMINKSTFYKYYDDKYDLRSYILAKGLTDFSNSIDVSYLYFPHREVNCYEEKLPSAIQPIFDHRKELMILWSKNMESNVFEQMQDIYAKKFLISLKKTKHKNLPESFQILNANLFAASAMQIIKWWFEISPNSTSKEIAHIITICIKSGSYDILQDTN